MITMLITGANRGIGLALTKQLRARGDTVIGVCRTSSVQLEATGAQVEAGVDVSSQSDVAALAQRLQGVRLDGLIANAGILHHESLSQLDFDSIREQLEVNALGPLRVVGALQGNLQQGSKVALVTSRMGSIADNSSGGAYGYRMSKAALNAAGVSLAHDLRPRGVAVAMLHPGYVRTDMTGQTGNVDANESARLLIERIDALTLNSSGTFWHANGEILPW